mgnify:CR=1 FL=1
MAYPGISGQKICTYQSTQDRDQRNRKGPEIRAFSLWFHKLLQFIHKGAYILKFTIYGCKADICNSIEIFEMLHDNLTDAGAGDLFICILNSTHEEHRPGSWSGDKLLLSDPS